MLQTDRFQLQKTVKHPYLQPDCPVYVYCTRQSEDRRSGARLVQIRMVNCGVGSVGTVVFDIEGLTPWGEVCFSLPALVMTGCKAAHGKVFGDDKVFSLKGNRASKLRVIVRQVIFADGMSWKCQSSHSLTTVEEAGWKICNCGMPNPPLREFCVFCGAALLKKAQIDLLKTQDIPVINFDTEPICAAPLTVAEPEPQPNPLVDSRVQPAKPPAWDFERYEDSSPQDFDDEDEEDEESVPVWLAVLLCVFGTLALLALLAFAAFFLHQYIL